MEKNGRKMIRIAGLAVLVLAGLLLLTFAMPIRSWRTGQMPAPPLPLQPGGSFSGSPHRVWIDTDAACGAAREADVDDCFALLLLLKSPQLDIAGISTVFGNAPVDVTDRTVRELAARLKSEGIAAVPVYRGSARPLSGQAKNSAPAQRALRRALEDGPLTIVALGPLTNIAAALRGRPDLQAKVAGLVADMGHRPLHLFHPAEGKGHGGVLFGHGPVFRDFNFAGDPVAVQYMVEMHVPLILVPYEAARGVSLNTDDLDRVAAAGNAEKWVVSRSRGWLNFWDRDIGLPGFYPFDLVAAAYLMNPGLFRCAEAETWIAPDRGLLGGLYEPLSLLVGLDSERSGAVRSSGDAVYCPQVDGTFHAWLMRRLLNE